MMKNLTILLLTVELLAACNHSSESMTNAIDSEQQNKKDSVLVQKGEEKPADSIGYTWSKADQTRFLNDCDKEFEENISKSKRIDFCNCILTEGQKYYSSYKQMRDNDNEDHDEEIGKCLAEFMEDEDYE